MRHVHRKLYDKKQKLKSRDKSDKEPVTVTDEEIQEEIDRENETRSVKIHLNVKLIKSAARSRNNLNSASNNFAVPATPIKKSSARIQNTPRKLNTPRKSLSTTKKSSPTSMIDESERKKIYHKLYVRKWKQNQTAGITSPIHIADEEILHEYSSNMS